MKYFLSNTAIIVVSARLKVWLHELQIANTRKCSSVQYNSNVSFHYSSVYTVSKAKMHMKPRITFTVYWVIFMGANFSRMPADTPEEIWWILP